MATTAERMSDIRRLLQERLQPTELNLLDESARHAGHAGAASGGHFRLRVVSKAFSGLPLVQRHRLVHDALAPLFGSDIHALALETLAPDEL
ncbi:MAG: BolA family protein [Steroidobacteraceae bacterium]|jgi:BolA family transcriptional regulator, general stress-responsive regulator